MWSHTTAHFRSVYLFQSPSTFRKLVTFDRSENCTEISCVFYWVVSVTRGLTTRNWMSLPLQNKGSLKLIPFFSRFGSLNKHNLSSKVLKVILVHSLYLTFLNTWFLEFFVSNQAYIFLTCKSSIQFIFTQISATSYLMLVVLLSLLWFINFTLH